MIFVRLSRTSLSNSHSNDRLYPVNDLSYCGVFLSLSFAHKFIICLVFCKLLMAITCIFILKLLTVSITTYVFFARQYVLCLFTLAYFILVHRIFLMINTICYNYPSPKHFETLTKSH